METKKSGGATLQYSVNKHSEVNTKGGKLTDWHVSSTIRLIWHLSDDLKIIITPGTVEWNSVCQLNCKSHQPIYIQSCDLMTVHQNALAEKKCAKNMVLKNA